MSDESEAITEVAKTTGKVTDAVREFGGFVVKYIDGPLEQAVGIVKDHLIYTRWKRAVRMMDRATYYQKELGHSSPTQALPLNLAIPILQAGSLEEDDSLQDRYALLLANAADANAATEIRRAFVSILEDLTPLDVEILDAIYLHKLAVPPDPNDRNAFWTTHLPGEILLERPEGDINPEFNVQVSVMNLARLGLLNSAIAYGGNAMVGCVHQTPLGLVFFEACSPCARGSR
jgi:hypothetical protein